MRDTLFELPYIEGKALRLLEVSLGQDCLALAMAPWFDQADCLARLRESLPLPERSAMDEELAFNPHPSPAKRRLARAAFGLEGLGRWKERDRRYWIEADPVSLSEAFMDAPACFPWSEPSRSAYAALLARLEPDDAMVEAALDRLRAGLKEAVERGILDRVPSPREPGSFWAVTSLVDFPAFSLFLRGMDTEDLAVLMARGPEVFRAKAFPLYDARNRETLLSAVAAANRGESALERAVAAGLGSLAQVEAECGWLARTSYRVSR